VLFVTDERGAALLEEKATLIPAAGFFGRSLRGKLKAAGAYLKGRRRSARLLADFRPDVVIGVGGYASLPVLMAARAKKIPCFLLEQNSVPGRVTRFAARAAREVYCGIPPVKRIPARVVVTGNPLRRSVILKGRRKAKEILIQGGSQGARVLNELGYALARRMPQERFIILTGRRDFPRMKAKPVLKNAELVEFTEHPQELYARARLAVSRAGAIALSELLANGIPSILVPFPYAVDDHQTYNARWAQDAGAGVLVDEGRIEDVGGILEELLDDSARLARMSRAAKTIAQTNAAERIAERIERCLAG